MEVGDLVKYKTMHALHHLSLGVVLKTPEETRNGDYEVLFGDEVRFSRGKLMEVVSESR